MKTSIGTRARKALRGTWLALVAGAVSAGVPAAAGAATIKVTTQGDEFNANPGACSLREAIWSANHDLVLQTPGCRQGSGADQVTVPPGDYRLTIPGAGEQGTATGDLDVTAPVAIRHRGDGAAVIDARGLDRVFEINAPGGAAVTISQLAINGGHAVGPADVTSAGAGGGVLVSAGALTLTGSTVAGNLADSWGGGIETRPGAASSLVDVTVSGNRARRDGGGVDTTGGTTSMLNVTVTDNVADAEANFPGGGGVGNFGGTTTMRNTLIAGNRERRGVTPDCFNAAGATLASQGQTLIGNTAGCGYTAAAGDITGVDAELGPLADNGGPTETHALLPGSPAVDKGFACAKADQRLVPRTAGGACDIGAYELVRCRGRVADRTGTNGADVLTGTPGPDAFLLLGGNDRATGLGGSDVFCGAAGRDTAIGGKGRDRAYGETGRDRLVGSGGNDLLAGAGGSDVLLGGAGNDEMRGDGAEDTCNGGPGNADDAAGCELERSIP